ncbi:hypothetical protein ACJJTC_012600 [Scirpophaga incertulas]
MYKNYYYTKVKNSKRRWRCHITSSYFEMIVTVTDKKLLKYQGYYYTRVPSSSRRWRCINTSFCYSTLLFNDHNMLKKAPKQHYHPPKQFVQLDNGKNVTIIYMHRLFSAVSFITTLTNKLVLKYREHYYTKVPNRKTAWRCVNTKTCFVGVVLDLEGRVKKEPRCHNHPPKNFIRTCDGRYKLIKEPPTRYGFIDWYRTGTWNIPLNS